MNIKQFIDNLKDNGVPVILLRDPKTKEPSISFTLVVVSFIYLSMGIFSNYFTFLKGIKIC